MKASMNTKKNTKKNKAITSCRTGLEVKEKVRRREISRAFLEQYKTDGKLLGRLRTHYADIVSKINASEKRGKRNASNKATVYATHKKDMLKEEKVALEKQMKGLEKNIVYTEYILGRLPERHQKIAKAFLFSDATKEVAIKLRRKYFVCETRIKQLYNEALERIYTALDKTNRFEITAGKASDTINNDWITQS